MRESPKRKKENRLKTTKEKPKMKTGDKKRKQSFAVIMSKGQRKMTSRSQRKTISV